MKNKNISFQIFGIKIFEWSEEEILEESIKESKISDNIVTKKDYEILKEYRLKGFIENREY